MKNNQQKAKITTKQEETYITNDKHNHQLREHIRWRTLSKPGVANMAKGRVTETQAAMKSATRCGNIYGRVDKTKSSNRGAVPELSKSDHQKPYLENQDEKGLSM
ncbi:hypothetical protein DY000_02020860 [Brassica cretica]|uniref:Uncharacterized protein n=1 Tax=Brassica cretica TaxID=69181 RepID=A0ABQ7EBA3_BRACR|nr:hypothetical protein DY000_02020860 [Brassica cretica]